MSAFPDSGHSDDAKTSEIKFRFRPLADIVVAALDHCLSKAFGRLQVVVIDRYTGDAREGNG